jgi:hypothetical protein
LHRGLKRQSFFFGAGRGASPKQAAVVAIIEDQNATHNNAGMTLSPLWIGQSKPALQQRSCCSAVPATERDTDA